jgi:hypothetical protein
MRVFHARVRERWRDRVRGVLPGLFTPGPGDWETVPLPDSLFFLYRLLRPIRLALKYARVLTRRESPLVFVPPLHVVERGTGGEDIVERGSGGEDHPGEGVRG